MNVHSRRWFSLLAIALLISLLAAACGDGGGDGGDDSAEGEGGEELEEGETPDDTLAAAQDAGYIRVGFANEAPYGFADEGGNLTGEAPEVAREVMAGLDVEELDGVLTEFGSLIPGLNAGRFDIVAAGMFITPERCEEALFSDPDYCAPQAFAVEAGNPQGLEDYESVAANPDVQLGVLQGAVEEGYALDLGVSEDQINVFPDPPSMMEGLQAGRVDAIALTSISIRDLLDTFGDDEELVGPFVPVIDGEEQLGCGGYAFRPQDEEFRDTFNEELRSMMESGDILEIIEPFGFGEEEVELALETTSEELCEG